jgi:hypothetical protein
MDGRNILKGYQALEQKLGSRFRPRHKADTIKQVWAKHRKLDL